jgi:hypothetical protein
MKTTETISMLLLVLFSTVSALAQTASSKSGKSLTKETEMKTYVIEREIPGAGDLNAEELKSISQKSCSVLKELGPGIEWVQSYVTDDKIYCIYRAQNEEILRVHANKGGFPANAIHELSTIISPQTAN